MVFEAKIAPALRVVEAKRIVEGDIPVKRVPCLGTSLKYIPALKESKREFKPAR